jgi:hypothetical protein
MCFVFYVPFHLSKNLFISGVTKAFNVNVLFFFVVDLLFYVFLCLIFGLQTLPLFLICFSSIKGKKEKKKKRRKGGEKSRHMRYNFKNFIQYHPHSHPLPFFFFLFQRGKEKTKKREGQ